MVSVAQLTGHAPDRRTFEPDERYRLPRCAVGLEFELENMPMTGEMMRTCPLDWRITEDGSLRDNGIEMVLQRPLYGRDLTTALNQLSEWLRNFEPRTSKRTSVHVHLDVRDMSIEQVVTMTLLYLTFERAICHYHGNQRVNNIFCLPYFKAPNLFHLLGDCLGNQNPDRIGDALSWTTKYCAYNLASMFRQGSVEFRHMPGCTDMERVTEWINLIFCLKAAAMDGVDPIRIPEMLSGNGVLGMAEMVFGGELSRKLWYPEFEQDGYSGVRLAQDVIHLRDMLAYTESYRYTPRREVSQVATNFVRRITGEMTPEERVQLEADARIQELEERHAEMARRMREPRPAAFVGEAPRPRRRGIL